MANLPIDTQPFALAAESLAQRTPVASRLNTAGWARVPVELRDRAFFSARMEHARTLSEMKRAIGNVLSQNRRADGTFQRRDQFVAEMRDALRKLGLDDGTDSIRNFASDRRLQLIYDHNLEDAQNAARWKVGQDPDALTAFPCQELIRVKNRRERRNWSRRWRGAGGKMFKGRMIARKDDDIWRQISRFDKPHPPFDFNSGMGTRNVSYDECVELGVIEPDAKVSPEEQPLNKGLEAGTATNEPFTVAALKKQFGDQLRIEGDRVHFEGELVKQMYDEVSTPGLFPYREINFGKAGKKAIALASSKNVDLEDAELVITSQRMRHIIKKHGKRDTLFEGSGETDPSQIPLSLEDFELIPFLWRNPDSVEGKGTQKLQVFKKNIDRKTVLVTYERNQRTKTWEPKTMYIKKLVSDGMQ